MRSKLTVCVALFLGLVSVAAALVDPALLPRNVLVSNMAPGARSQISLFLDWDAPTRLATGVTSDQLTYQVFAKCKFEAVAPAQLAGGSAGTTLVKGPGPHFRLIGSVCNCSEQKISLAVRVFLPKAQATREMVFAGSIPPGGNTTDKAATWLEAKCGT